MDPVPDVQVGGPFWTAATQQMKNFGRIAVCGGIATYNDTTPKTCAYSPHLHCLHLYITVLLRFPQFNSTPACENKVESSDGLKWFPLEGIIVLLKTPVVTEFVVDSLLLFFFPFYHLPLSGPYPHLTMIFKQLKVEGFMQSRWEHKHPESLKRLMGWVKEVSDWKEVISTLDLIQVSWVFSRISNLCVASVLHLV